jgi:hypothetical protein
MTLANLPNVEQSSNSLTSEVPLPEITPQQRAFVTHYLLEYDINKASAYAGMNPIDGKMMLRHPEVMAHIQSLQAAREKFCIIGKDFAAFQLLDILPKLKGEVEIPLVTKNGSEFMAKKFHGPELIAAIREINNVSGLTKPHDVGPKKAAVSISLNFAGMANQPSVEIKGEQS